MPALLRWLSPEGDLIGPYPSRPLFLLVLARECVLRSSVCTVSLGRISFCLLRQERAAHGSTLQQLAGSTA